MCACATGKREVWRSQDNFVELVLSFIRTQPPGVDSGPGPLLPFLRQSHYIGQSGFGLAVLLPQPPEHGHYRHEPSYPADVLSNRCGPLAVAFLSFVDMWFILRLYLDCKVPSTRQSLGKNP